MKCALLITDPALAEIEEAYAWLAAQAPEEAVAWYNGLVDKMQSLKTLPGRCALAPENDDLPFETRQLLYGDRRHRIIFTMHQESVLVLHVRHAARRSFSEEN